MAPVETQRSRRNKLVNFIDYENCRNLSFKKRKSTVKKKATQLSTLCDVNVCMVCFGPDQTVETVPENKSDVVDLIIKYRGLSAKAREKGNQKYNLLGFLGDKKRRLDEKLNKPVGEQHEMRKNNEELVKNNLGSADSRWDEKLNLFSEGELVRVCGNLDCKLQELREKIRVLQMKKEKTVDDDDQFENHEFHIAPNNLDYNPIRFNGDYFQNHQYHDADFGRVDNTTFLDENYNYNHVGMVNNDNYLLLDKNFYLGFAHATMGFKTGQSLGLIGESSHSSNYIQPDDYLFMFSHASPASLLQEVYPISMGPSLPFSDIKSHQFDQATFG